MGESLLSHLTKTHVGHESHLTGLFLGAFYVLVEFSLNSAHSLDKDLECTHCTLTLARSLWLTLHFWELLCNFLRAAWALAIWYQLEARALPLNGLWLITAHIPVIWDGAASSSFIEDLFSSFFLGVGCWQIKSKEEANAHLRLGRVFWPQGEVSGNQKTGALFLTYCECLWAGLGIYRNMVR